MIGVPDVPAEVFRRIGLRIRTSEKVSIAYFLYIALLTMARDLSPMRIGLAWCIAAVVALLAWAARSSTSRWVAVLRDWIPLILIPVGYWELQLFASSRVLGWQQTWIGWDRRLLHEWGLGPTVEVLGPAIPSFLEATYLCLYGIPSLCLAVLYIHGRRDRIDRFLTTLLLGGFCAYALIPLFPSISPRLAFPGSDLPHFASSIRASNLWILDHLDISTSVFPSGHVAVAFASAFGLLRARPEKRWLSYLLLAVSAVVYVATIYSRYHYAVDGMAAAAIAVLAWRTSELLEPQHKAWD